MTLVFGLVAKGVIQTEDDSFLFLITLVLMVGSSLAAALLARRAPAVSFALIGAVVVGLCGFVIGGADGPHWLPSEVSVWASLGVAAGGLVGVMLTDGKPTDRRFLTRGGVIVLFLAPGAAIALGLALAEACPLYSRFLKGYCYYGDEDLLGGWATGVAMLFFLDLVTLGALFLISAHRARVQSGERPGS